MQLKKKKKFFRYFCIKSVPPSFVLRKNSILKYKNVSFYLPNRHEPSHQQHLQYIHNSTNPPGDHKTHFTLASFFSALAVISIHTHIHELVVIYETKNHGKCPPQPLEQYNAHNVIRRAAGVRAPRARFKKPARAYLKKLTFRAPSQGRVQQISSLGSCGLLPRDYTKELHNRAAQRDADAAMQLGPSA